MLSQKPDLPKDETFVHLLPDSPLTFTLPYALKTGKWYARGNWCTNCIFPDLNLEFDIPALPDEAPVKVIPKFQNGNFNPFPELVFSFYPYPPRSLVATVNGKPFAIVNSMDNEVVLKPLEKMEPAVYDLVINADGKAHTLQPRSRWTSSSMS